MSLVASHAAGPQAQTAAGRDQATPASAGRTALGALALLFLTAAAFQPVWFAGFIWDDDFMVTANRAVQAADGLRTIWFSTELPDYFPVTSTAFWLQWRLWGENPLGYHLVNVLLHGLSAVLWWRVLMRLALPGAWLAAAIFAVHPVNVESVAWISELKNTLAMVFFAAAIWAYLRFDDGASGRSYERKRVDEGRGNPLAHARSYTLEEPLAHARSYTWEEPLAHARSYGAEGLLAGTRRYGWYAAALGLFTLALLSKTAVAAFPLVVLGFAWWRRGRITREDVWRSVPFFAVSALLGVVTIWFQYVRAIGSTVVRTDDLWARLAGAGWAVWFYLSKALLPANLAIVYPRWQIDGTRPLAYLPALLAVVGLVLCWRYRERWGRGPLFAAGYFLAMLLPILGFLNIGAMRYSLVADRWQYFALIAPIAVVVTGIVRAAQALRVGSGARAVAPILAFVLLASLGTATWRQTQCYRDPQTLWHATLERNPHCAIAHNEVGNQLFTERKVDAAIEHFQKALAILPNYEVAHYNYGCALLEKGEIDAALEQFRKSVASEPALFKARYNLGTTLLKHGQIDEAIVHLTKAVELEPRHAPARNNLASALVESGQLEAALEHYRAALALEPNHASARNNLGWNLLRAGRVDEAIEQLEAALRLQPADAMAHNNLGEAFLQRGDRKGAITQFERALELQPAFIAAGVNLGSALLQEGRATEAVARLRVAVEAASKDADAHNLLANALLQTGAISEARRHYEEALKLQPEHAIAHNNLGWVLFQTGQSPDGLAHLRRAVALDPGYANAHRNLGDVLAARGELEPAIRAFETALRLRPDDGAAHLSLGRAQLRQKDFARARESYEAALRLEPRNVDTIATIAWILATCSEETVRNGKRALELIDRATLVAAPENPALLRVRAAAQAETRQFAEAIVTAKAALRLAEESRMTRLVTALKSDLSAYEAGAALREDASAPPQAPHAEAPTPEDL